MQTLLTPSETANILQITQGTLANWRLEKKYLPYIKVGKSVRYKKDDIEKFLTTINIVANTESDETCNAVIKCYEAGIECNALNMLAFASKNWFRCDNLHLIKKITDITDKFNIFGFVYIIQYQDSYYKIGKTQNPYARITSLQNEAKHYNKEITKIIISKPHINFSANEKKLLNFFDKNQKSGEYVLTNIDDVINAINIVEFNDKVQDIAAKKATKTNDNSLQNLVLNARFKAGIIPMEFKK
jgi:excisionase family DNA binding protein